jgi:hypothetical protein
MKHTLRVLAVVVSTAIAVSLASVAFFARPASAAEACPGFEEWCTCNPPPLQGCTWSCSIICIWAPPNCWKDCNCTCYY